VISEITNAADFGPQVSGGSGIGIPWISGITNGADFGSPVAPGSWIAIWAENLPVATQQATAIPLPPDLGGVRVLVAGSPAPIWSVSPTQVYAQLPYDVPGVVDVILEAFGVCSPPVLLSIANTAPAFFSIDGRAVAQNVDAQTGTVTVNSPVNPAPNAGYLILYLTGQGLLDAAIPAGNATPTYPLAKPLAPVMLLDGARKPLDITFAGMTPGLVGILQINMRVPEEIHGDVQLICVVGIVTSRPVLVSVQ
jgi:uncharacterized protein (TIGR03437 family)